MDFYRFLTIAVVALLDITIILCFAYGFRQLVKGSQGNTKPARSVMLTGISTFCFLCATVIVASVLFLANVQAFGGITVFPGMVAVSQTGDVYSPGVYFNHNNAILVNSSSESRYVRGLRNYNPMRKTALCSIQYRIEDPSKLRYLHEYFIGIDDYRSLEAFLQQRLQSIVEEAVTIADAEHGMRALCATLGDCGLDVEASLTMTFPAKAYEYQRHLDQEPLPIEPIE